jgi:hypothetical protein
MARRDLISRLERLEHTVIREPIDPAAEAAQHGEPRWHTPDGTRCYGTDDSVTVLGPHGTLTYRVTLTEAAA